jgi:hypothetical protein
MNEYTQLVLVQGSPLSPAFELFGP